MTAILDSINKSFVMVINYCFSHNFLNSIKIHQPYKRMRIKYILEEEMEDKNSISCLLKKNNVSIYKKAIFYKRNNIIMVRLIAKKKSEIRDFILEKLEKIKDFDIYDSIDENE